MLRGTVLRGLWVVLAAAPLFLGAGVALAQTSGDTLEHDGQTRRFHVYVPSSYDDTQPTPLVIVLHPFASSGRAMEALTGFDGAAEAQGFIVAYPDSLDMYWDDGRSRAGWPADAEAIDDPGFIAALIEHLAAGYNVDQGRIHLVGLAQGGTMAYELACQAPERFASVAVVGALVWNFHLEGCPPPAAPVNLLIALGTEDPYYPAAGRVVSEEEGAARSTASLDDTLAFWAGRDGCDPDAVREDTAGIRVYDTCDGGESLTFFSMDGVGHNWPRLGDYTLNQYRLDMTEIVSRYLTGDDSWKELAAALTTDDLYNGVPRNYLVYVPPSYDPVAPMPLVLALHGRPSNGAEFAYILDMNRVAREHGFIIVYPDGIEEGWNYTRGSEGYYDHGIDEVDFLRVLAADLALDLNLDARRMYITGFSNGGFMTQRMACEAADQFAAFAVVGATLFPDFVYLCQGARLAPILLMHGTEDRSVPWQGVAQPGPDGTAMLTAFSAPDTFGFWAVHNGCDVEQTAHTVLPAEDPDATTTVHLFELGGCQADVLFYGIVGGGHNLPGVQGRLNPAIAGETNMDIHAGEVIWDFFSRQTLPDGE